MRAVVPLCAVEGYTWLGIELSDATMFERSIPLPEDGDFSGDPLEGYDWAGDMSYRLCRSEDPQRVLFEFFRYDDPDGDVPGELCQGAPATGVS